METRELNIDDGLVEYKLNGKCSVIINPTDATFAEKLYSTFTTLDELKDAYEKRIKSMSDQKEIFKIAREQDAELRKLIDAIFDKPVCSSLFDGMNVCALADGLPVWANFLLAIMDETGSAFAEEQKLTNPRVAKYTSKYHK